MKTLYKIAVSVFLFALLTACSGGGGGSGGGDVQTNAPSISNLSLSAAQLPLPRPGDLYLVDLSFVFADADSDISNLQLTRIAPDGTQSVTDISFNPTVNNGSYRKQLLIDDTYSAGQHVIAVNLRDAQNNRSNSESVTLAIDPSAQPILSIDSITPDHGVPGDVVTINGTGFNPDVTQNNVFFRGAAARARVLSASEQQLEVVVPPGSLSGELFLEGLQAQTRSSLSFNISPGIVITPAEITMHTGDVMDFSCIPFGVENPSLVWTVNDSNIPNPLVGIIDSNGHYSAPADLTAAVVTIRCALQADPQVSANSQVTITNPIPATGGGIARTLTGATLTNDEGGITLQIPANAITQDTEISITTVDPLDVTPASVNQYVVAAVELQPSDVQFTQAATITFELRDSQTPDSSLALYLYDETNNEYVATGSSVIVDSSGWKANGAISRFGRLAVMAQTEVAMTTTAGRFVSAYGNLFPEFVLETEPRLQFLEGLSVPILIRRNGGPGVGAGPFVRGVSARATIDDYSAPNNSMVVGPLVQASEDGWMLGTVINIPVLPGCRPARLIGEIGTLDATLEIFYQPAGQAQSESMRLPFVIHCLDELIVNGHNTQEELPNDVHIFTEAVSTPQGLTTKQFIKLLPDAHYQFSQLTVEQDGRLGVILPVQGTYSNPLTIEVTGEVRIAGSFNLAGIAGNIGGNGTGDEDGGAAGFPGRLHGARGGRGGPTACGSPHGCDNDGWRGSHAQIDFGGTGGPGGVEWEQGEWFSIPIFAYAPLPISLRQYFIANELVQILNNSDNFTRSAGGGGFAGNSAAPLDVAFFRPPQGGGGAGGAGRALGLFDDKPGGGGGGGGGGAANLMLVSAKSVYIASTGLIDGAGGSGGQGGNGQGSGDSQGAPGGGGAGGSGSAIQIIARNGFVNNGTIKAPGGLGAPSGAVTREVIGQATKVIVQRGTGGDGADGVLRVDGHYSGKSPTSMARYAGPRISDGSFYATTAAAWCQTVYMGDSGYVHRDANTRPIHQEQICFPLGDTLNAIGLAINSEISVQLQPLHPWQNQYVFYFPQMLDSDGDGLWDRDEAALGTDPHNPDSDGDGAPDGMEVGMGFDPLDPYSYPEA